MRAKRLPLGLKKTKHNKMIKRLMVIALSLFVVFSQMSLSPLGKAFAEDGTTQQNNNQFFDAVKLTTGEGDSIKEVNAENPLKQGDAVNLDYSWTQKNGQQLSADQDVTIQIPSQFKVGTKDADGKYTTDITGDVKLADNTTVIGTYTVKASDGAVDANKLIIHFANEKTQSLTGAAGKIVVPTVFNDEIKADQTVDSIDFDLGNNQKQTVSVAMKTDAEQADASTSESAAGLSDASSAEQTKKDDGSSVNESKASDSSSSSDGSSASASSEQGNKDGSDEGQTNSADSSNTNNVFSQKQSSNQLRSFLLFSAQSTSKEITDLQPSNIKLVDPDNGDKEYTASYPATTNSSVKIEYAWDVPESVRQTINEGDTLSFTLPNIFSIPSNQAPLSGKLLDKNGVDYGSFTVDANGKVIMTFSDQFQNHNNVSFGMYVTAQINKQNTGDSTTKIINFPINGKTETATLYFQDGFSSPIKKDFSNFDSNHNPKEITWQVDVNLNKHELQNAQVVEDLTSEGLTFESVSVYPLSTNAVKGTVGSADTSNPLSENASADGDKGEYAVDKSTGTVTLGHITGAYRLIYTTKINNDQIPSDGGSKTFTNTAILKDGQTNLGSDPAEAPATYGKLLTKTYLGQDANNKQLTHWEIDYNYGEKTISQNQAIITDTFDTSKFQYLNVKVQKVTWNASGVPTSSDITSGYHVNSTSNGFQIVFDQEVTSAYKITYDLAVKPGAVYIDQGTNFSNTAETGTVSTGGITGHVDQQSLIKSHSNIDYKKKTVDWTIMVNEKSYPLNTWSIDDTFSYPLSNLSNLKIYTATSSTDSNGAVTWSKGSDVTSDFNIGSTNSKGNPGFTIAPKSGSTYYNTNVTFMITYTTNFNGYTAQNDSGNITTITNNSILDWYEATTNTKHETSTSDDFTPNGYTQTNGFKTHENYDPVNQNVLWKVYVNYNEEPLDNAYINDPIPDGMKFDDTVPVKVYKYDINSDGSVTNEQEITSGFTITKPTSGNNALRIDFSGLNGDKGHYMVGFATDLRGQVVQSSYTNNATFKNGSYPERILTDTVQPTNGGQWLGKYGTQDGKYVAWTLDVNKSLSVINPGMVIKDTSSSGQIVDKNSLEIYPAKVTNGVVQTDGLGNLVADKDNPLSEGDYSVNVPAPDSSGKQVFTITFNKQINATAYVVSYKSLINISKSTGMLTNSAEFNGNNSQVIQDTNNQNTKVVNLSAGGWAVGTTGNLTIHKTGHTVLGDSALKNVTFELWSEDASGNADTLLRTGTTDDNGNLTFSGLVLGSGIKYILKETSTLEGYVVNSPQEIDTGKVSSGSTVSVINNQNQLTVQKLVNDGDSAKGTQFTLYKKNLDGNYSVDTTRGNNGVFTISDESGKVVLAGLYHGDYYLTESKAPIGYLINDNQINFSVNQNNQIVNSTGSVITDPIQFQDYKGSVTLTKQDKAGKTITESGAAFSLQKLKDGVDIGQAKDTDWETQTGIDQSKMTTDTNGQFKLDGLAPGTYRFVETKAPADYLINDTPTDPFVITGNAMGEPDPVSVKATDYKGSVTLTKQDKAGDTIKEPGAEFSLQKLKDGVDVNQAKDTDWESQTGIEQSEMTTDANGQFKLDGLAPGTYRFAESKAPAGYLINDTPTDPFVITGNVMGEPDSVSVKATDYQGSVTLTKQDKAGDTIKEPGAEFSLQKLKNGVDVKEARDSDWETQAEIDKSKMTTDDNGQFKLDGLAPGTYRFAETKAPAGYLINNTPTDPFVITDHAANKPDTVQVTATDYKGSVKFSKTDLDGNILSGATFDFQQYLEGVWKTYPYLNNELDVLTATGTTTIDGLAPGQYQFVELTAPNGYLLDRTPIQFTIDNASVGEPAAIKSQKDLVNSVVLTKVDKNDTNAKLVGAEYKLVKKGTDEVVDKDINGNNLNSIWTTDEHGQFTVTGLPSGDYEFIETKAPDGYELDTARIPFTVTNKDVQAQEITATDDLNETVLTKVDENDKNAVLTGAEFKLQDSNGKAVTKDITGKDLPATWTTDEKGQFTVKGLPEGNYQFIETKAPNGYQLDTTPIPFTVTKTGTKAVEITATDKLSEVVLTKVDKNDKDAVLKGAEFKLVDKDGNVVEKDATGKTLSKVWTTDEKGQFAVKGLPNGKYNFIETKAPNGYELDATPIPFEVTNQDTKAIPITATDKLNSVVLTKVDENDKGAVLAGAEFTLYDSNGKVVEKDANGKTLPSVWTTDEKGQFTVNGLAPGNYHFIETKAPKNYDLDTTPIPFQVTNTDIKAIPITATDKLTPGDVRLTKVDRNDKDAVLKGAEFKLTDSNGKTLKTGLTTDNSGQFVVKGLAPGKYFFIETKAPKNYALDETPIPFVIEKGQSRAVEITATDKPLEITRTLDGKPGATYNVVDKNGHVIARGVMADEEGNVNFKGLATGQYHLILVRSVEAETQTSKKANAKGLPITGDTNDIMTMAAGALLLLGGGSLAIFSRRRRKN
ncbi:SpaA isopeptide-forming pilin-related protein [Sporolactobacillus laevolacticus]|uniref:SpaA isopeptide-forming pilin-related protein n=1 Tax=Sporolactobacillus laevolacticus TaxID=33018 RepID=UPI0025B3EAFD|nr:SpaA isopeptide-forming pilin-related protein [Sporolactobacillus laevolacticus]MDN3955141.1 SpaA isopeptide-forming pilin-related protein [Sporolactobacillus laevolacticus]